jgi:glycosyltransferase involved in cell wall biosynthesis
MASGRIRVLQIMHGPAAPFGELARLYAGAFDPECWELLTLFLTGDPDPELARRFPGQVRFLELPSRRLGGIKLGLVRYLLRLHREFPFRLVIAHRYKALYSALLASLRLPPVRVIGVAHAFGVLERAARRALLRLLRRRVYLVGVSQAVADDLRRAAPFLDPGRVAALPNGLDLKALQAIQLPRQRARAELGLEEGNCAFVTIGRYHPDKDQAGMLRAFARAAPEMPGAQLLLIGAGRLRPALEAQVQDLGLAGRARVLGPIPAAARLLPGCDVYCSSSDREPFGMVLTEAMAARLPVISSDCGGAPEVLGTLGRYFRRGDNAALAARMLDLYRMPVAARQELGQALFQRLEQEFTPEPFRRRLMGLPMLAEYLNRIDAG